MKYIVALSTGGLMECPEMYYENFQVIEAENDKQAEEIYNKKNNCNYFWGVTLCEYNDKTKWFAERKRPIAREVVLHMLAEKLNIGK